MQKIIAKKKHFIDTQEKRAVLFIIDYQFQSEDTYRNLDDEELVDSYEEDLKEVMIARPNISNTSLVRENQL